MRTWSKIGPTALTVMALAACVAQTAVSPPDPTGKSNAGGTRTLLNQTEASPAGQQPRSSEQHPTFGPVGNMFGGALLPFASNQRRRTGLRFADLGRATVFEVPALSGADYVRLSRGGRFAVFEERGELGIYDLKTQLIQTFPQLQNRYRDARLVDVDAYGNIAYLDDRGRVHVFDTGTRQDFIVPAAGRYIRPGQGLSLAGNGRSIAFSSYSRGGNEILLTDLSTGRQFSFPFLSGSRERIYAFELSSNGECLLFQQGNRIKLLNTRTGFIDNLALLNQGGSSWPSTLGFGSPISGAAFLDGRCDRIIFERNGQVQVFDRASGLIDTLPVLNRAFDTRGLRRRRDWHFVPIS